MRLGKILKLKWDGIDFNQKLIYYYEWQKQREKRNFDERSGRGGA